jgi:hypothetical protein
VNGVIPDDRTKIRSGALKHRRALFHLDGLLDTGHRKTEVSGDYGPGFQVDPGPFNTRETLGPHLYAVDAYGKQWEAKEPQFVGQSPAPQ